MIESFKHRGLRRLYERDERSGIRPDPLETVERILTVLDAVTTPPVQGRLIVRSENLPVVVPLCEMEKMKTPQAQAIYGERKRVAEFPYLWIK